MLANRETCTINILKYFFHTANNLIPCTRQNKHFTVSQILSTYNVTIKKYDINLFVFIYRFCAWACLRCTVTTLSGLCRSVLMPCAPNSLEGWQEITKRRTKRRSSFYKRPHLIINHYSKTLLLRPLFWSEEKWSL